METMKLSRESQKVSQEELTEAIKWAKRAEGSQEAGEHVQNSEVSEADTGSEQKSNIQGGRGILTPFQFFQ